MSSRVIVDEYSRRTLLDINQATGYYAYVNRLVGILGVELEPFWED